MSRNFVALVVLALTGTALVLPGPSVAGPTAMPGGAARAGGFRAPMIVHPSARASILRAAPHVLAAPHIAPYATRPAVRSVAHGFANHRRFVRNHLFDFRSRFVRRHHHGFIAGYVYPFTTDSYGDQAYIGTPYDPSEMYPDYAPVYAMPPAADEPATAPKPAAPRLSSAREQSPDACRSERVTVPESKGDGEREITVVRC